MAGGSGGKRMKITTRERSVSNDYNRGWAFNAAHMTDAFFYLLNGGAGGLERGGGRQDFITGTDVVASPLGATVLGGLMVLCPAGSTELGIQAGAAILDDPDGVTGSSNATAQSADDSIAKLVVDNVGILVGSGSLVFTANVSGSIRVDVVECRRTATAAVETSSRDIYDTGTQSFAAALVTKVDTTTMEYRIRLGTPGAGLPAVAQGWLPLAVAGVAIGATSFDDCVLYDVRPLASDREALVAGSTNETSQRWGRIDGDPITDINVNGRVYGSVHTYVNGYRAGGKLSSVGTSITVGSDVDYVEVGYGQTTQQPHDSSNLTRDPGAGDTRGYRPYWLMFPAGLPRWVRYSVANVAPFASRVPYGPRGVLVATDTLELDGTGRTSAVAVAMPPSSGLDATTTATDGFIAFCVVTGTTGNANFNLMTSKDGREFRPLSSPNLFSWNNAIPAGTISISEMTQHTALTFSLLTMPKSSTAVLLNGYGTLTVTSAGTRVSWAPQLVVSRGDNSLDASAPLFPTVVYFPSVGENQRHYDGDNGATIPVTVIADVNLPLQVPGQEADLTTWQLIVDFNPANATLTSSGAYIQGFTLT